MAMFIEVKSRQHAKQFACDKPWAAISISTHAHEFPELREKNRVGLLQLCFADMANTDVDTETKATMFSEDQAQQILDFVEMHWNNIDTLLVHCEFGLCRSPAIAAAISKIKIGDGTDDYYWKRYIPNSYVYTTMMQVYFGENSLEADLARQAASDCAE